MNGASYNVTTFTGNYQDFPDKFNTPSNGGTMPWWGNDDLAGDFAWEVEAQLGLQEIPGDLSGPLFPTSLRDLSILTKVVYYAPGYNSTVATFVSSSDSLMGTSKIWCLQRTSLKIQGRTEASSQEPSIEDYGHIDKRAMIPWSDFMQTPSGSKCAGDTEES